MFTVGGKGVTETALVFLVYGVTQVSRGEDKYVDISINETVTNLQWMIKLSQYR